MATLHLKIQVVHVYIIGPRQALKAQLQVDMVQMPIDPIPYSHLFPTPTGSWEVPYYKLTMVWGMWKILSKIKGMEELESFNRCFYRMCRYHSKVDICNMSGSPSTTLKHSVEIHPYPRTSQKYFEIYFIYKKKQ